MWFASMAASAAAKAVSQCPIRASRRPWPGSDPEHSGWLRRFSNGFGSNASSEGGYVTGDYYHGRYGRSMRLSGLDWSNSNAETRAIVVHSAWYAEPEQLAAHGKLGRSEGCFALPYNSLQQVLARLGPGRFLYADKLA